MTEMMIHRMTMTLLMMIPQAPTVRPAAVLPVAAATLHLLRNQVLLMMILQAPEAVIPMVTN